MGWGCFGCVHFERKQEQMKIGSYQLPYEKDRKAISLLWDNKTDKDFTEAIKALQFKNNDIKQIVIKIEPQSMSYATKELLQYFMNQHYNRGVDYTTYLDENNKPHMKAQVNPKARFRTYIPSLHLLIGKHVYRLSPQMHIYPGSSDEMYVEPLSFQALAATASAHNVTYRAHSEYDYYKFVLEIIEKPVTQKEFIPQRELPDPEPTHEFTMFRPLCEAYEIDPTDSHAFEQIEYYVMNRIPITRMPHDEVFYSFCTELGIAPVAEELYDDSNLVYIGKETYLETYDDYN